MAIVLRQLLVPTDFSPTSEAALNYGCAFSEAFGAILHLLHVLEEPFVFAPGTEGYVPPIIDYAQLEEQAREQLERSLSAQQRAKTKMTTLLRRGAPFVEIVRYAREVPIDLIVIGTHGRGPIAHMLMGSVAEKVVRKAPCPVLTVRHPEHNFVLP